MSIVNDALKKIEAKQEAINPKPLVSQTKSEEKKESHSSELTKKRQNKALYWLIAIIGGFFLIAVVVSARMFRADKVPFKSNTIARENTTREPAGKVNNLFGPRARKKPFELTGIMYSEFEPAAIINNRVIKTGDVIEGATVESIQETLVKLSREGNEIILQVE
jgi:hypothetical protein